MKIVESRKMRLAGATRSSVKQAVLVGDQSIDLPSVEFQYPHVSATTPVVACRLPVFAR